MIKYFLFLFLPFSVFAGQYFNDVKPITTEAVTNLVTLPFLNIGFDCDKMNSVYSAVHLTKADIEGSKAIGRHNAFHAEESLPTTCQTTLGDWKNSYPKEDRGHKVGSNFAPTFTLQHDTFSLANMNPQVHAFNAGVWLGMEYKVADLTDTYGDTYMVSGDLLAVNPVYLTHKDGTVTDIPVPTDMWMGVVIPSKKTACVYVGHNDKSQTYVLTDLKSFFAKTGNNPFPGTDYHCNEKLFKLNGHYGKTPYSRKSLNNYLE